MACLADGLGLPADTFTKGTVDGEGKGDAQNVLRLLHYHSTEGKEFGPNFWRAGAHADFDVSPPTPVHDLHPFAPLNY